MSEKSKSEMETPTDAENKRKAKEGRLLFYVFGGLIVVLICLMFFIDYYAESKAGGPRTIHDAAEDH